MVAESAYATEGRLFIHAGGLRNIAPPSLPWVHPQLAFVIRVELEDHDFGHDHDLQITLRGPSGDEVVPRVVLPVTRSQMPERLDRPIFLQAALTLASIPISDYGPHPIELVIDGQPASSEILYVDPAEES